MNSRNLEFIRPYNRLRAKRLADDKLLSKRVLKKSGIAVPSLIAKIKTIEDLENFDWQSLPSSFALKPNRGFGGEGIIVVYGKKKGRDDAWVKADRSLITIEDLRSHIRNILDGSFSLSNTPDIAFFEERLQLLKLFKPYSYKGIPDIRVIVFNKVPVMAMLRLPTRESGGKANLQQGAVGVGIDMATGVTTTAIQGKNKFIEKIPGTNFPVSGIRIPYWKDILLLASKSQEISNLGFLGVDVAIDKNHGPVILELNARPGLSIQVANLAGLAERLRRVSGLKIKTIARGVRMGMDLFGGEIEEEVEEISGRKVIGTVEKIKLVGKDGKTIEVEAKIDTGADWSSIDDSLAKTLGFEKTIDEFEKLKMPYENLKKLDKKERWEIYKDIPDIVSTIPVKSSNGYTYRPMINIEFTMDTITIPTKITLVDRSHMKYPMIIGKINLNKFLIDVKK
ncbi:MAG: sugar-transfer associated ATP-grasp domain-containing protein [Candidatus Moranbacteria bacterium]|nr:sugar-transfer associated ATP-grasp domain-containing protein [Candidatus Moranbacteria bacterium]